MDHGRDVILVANSPGELSALVQPIVEKFRQKDKHIRLILFITPCQYASGREVNFANKIEGLTEVVSAKEYKKWLLGGPLPRNLSIKYRGVVLYLGGELMHATLIAKKLKYKAYAYLPGKHVAWTGVFEKFFLPDSSAKDHFLKKNVAQEKLEVVGDLMVNSIKIQDKKEAQKHWHLKEDRPIVAFMPGSREWELKHMIPLYERIIKILKKRVPDIQALLTVSPFVTVEKIEKYMKGHYFDALIPFSSLSAADLAVTIPGTNTAQLAVVGLPSIVVFPLDKPEAIPLEGIMHYITAIPVLGYFLKKLIAWIVNYKTKYFALPNMKAKKMIMPEIRGKIKPKEVALKIEKMLSRKEELKTTSKELKEIMGNSSASEKITKRILDEGFSETA